MQNPELASLLQRLRLQTVDGVHQAELDGRHYRLPPRLHEAACVMKTQGPEQGFATLMQRWDVAATQQSALRAELWQALTALEQSEIKHGYIHAGVTVLPASVVQRLSARLLPLFGLPAVCAVLLAFALLLLDLIVFHSVGGSELRRMDLSAADWLLGYLFTCAVLLFHELGHATGLRAVGQIPQQIGFGFFLVFPVFYANVSNAWLVARRSRFIVNLGGIYFQLIGALLLYAAIAFTDGHVRAFLSLAFKANLAAACFVLIPFIRNDGYWLLSDCLGLPDLYQRAGGMCWVIFQRLRARVSISATEWFIAAYAVCNYSFLALVILGLGRSIYRNAAQFGEIIHAGGANTLLLEHPALLVSSGITLLMFGVFTRPIIWRAYQHVKLKSRSI